MRRIVKLIAVSALIFAMAASAAIAAPRTTLSLWHYLGSDTSSMFKSLVDEWNAKNPAVFVELTYGGNNRTMQDKLLASIVAKAQPDMALMDQFWVPELANSGALLNLDGLLSETEEADFLAPARQAASYAGSLWTMPLGMSNQALYYNKDLFRAAGLNPNVPPSTWEEMFEAGLKLSKDTNKDGKVDQFGLYMPVTVNTGMVYYFVTFLWQAGAELYNKDYSAATFNSAAAVKAVQYLQKLVAYQVLPLANIADAFLNGRAAMALASTSSLGYYKSAAKFDLGVAHMPSGAKKVTGVGGNSLGIFKSDRDREAAAFSFVKWMTSAEVSTKWAIATGYTPTRKSALESKEYKELVAADPMVATIISQLDYARPRPNVLSYSRVSNIISAAGERVLFEYTKDPVATLDKAVADANAVIRELAKK
ncbi:MAG TPA: ABC transporter substrate-binding protein [Bacillota bacterium]|nr:ABC transporter substrate-binding protein [Bacillota bacterium]